MSVISTQENEKIILERIKIMGKNLIAISDFVSANKAKYVTPSMMVVEGEMELCMLQDSDPNYGTSGDDFGGNGGEDDVLGNMPAGIRFTYDFD